MYRFSYKQSIIREVSVMCEYTFIDIDEKDYDRYVLCLSYDSIYLVIKEIEEKLKNDSDSKRFLFDQLFLTGNTSNRFLSCVFSNGKLDYSSARIVDPPDYYRQETVEWLHDNYEYVNNSILSEELRYKIKNNILI